jgi:hypothetical protein
MKAATVKCPGQHAHGQVGPHGHPSSPGSGHEELELSEWLTWSALADACSASPAASETSPVTKSSTTSQVRRCSFMRQSPD